jgi:large repetitive protein
MRSILSIIILWIIAFTATSQTTPFPTAAQNYNEISPWGHTNAGTTWNTSNYLPFIYQGSWFRMMTPNSVIPTVTKDAAGVITNVSYNNTQPGVKYPLILFFQGAGEVGTDNNKQLLHGGEKHKNAVLSGTFPGYLVYPQSVYVDKAKDIIEKLIATHPIDVNRIYVHGLSNGAVWTWQFTMNNPTMVAAMAPMSGLNGTDPNLFYTPIRLAQGGLDKNPNPSYAQTIVDYYNTNGGQLEYFYFPNLGHGTWNDMYNRSDFFSWFLQQKSNNIKVRFKKTEYCPGETVSTTMGFAPGFSGYRWYKDGNLINGATTNQITVTSLGVYTGQILNRGTWYMSDPVEIKLKATTQTPPIQLAQLQSIVIPDINGNSSIGLTMPAGYETYSYSKDGVVIPGGNTQSITVNSTGSYTATVKEFGGCSSNPSVPLIILNAAGSPKPDPISNLQATTISKTEIRLNWENTANPTVNETGFEIYSALASSGPYNLIAVTAPDVVVYSNINLNANTNYYYKIRPISNTGAAAASAAVLGVTDVDIIPPTAPNNLAVTSTNQTSVGLSWSASTDNVGVTGYDVYVRPSTQTNYIKAYTTTGTTQLVAGLTPSTMYNFIVKAKDQAGNISPASNQVNSPTVLVGLNYAQYNGTWSALPDFSTLTPVTTGVVTTFSISPATQADFFGFVFTGFLQIPTTGSYTFTLNSDDGSKLWVNDVLRIDHDGLHGGTDKASAPITLAAGYYPIRCEYFERDGGQGLTVSWQGPGIGKQAIPASRLRENYTLPAAPAAPASLARTVLDYQSIRLNWNTYTGTGTDIEIYRSSPNSNAWYIIATIPKAQNTYTDTGLSPSTRYYYRLRAVNSGNVSAYTSSVNGITTALPPLPVAPTSLQSLAVGSNSTSLKWNDNSNNEDGFDLYKSPGVNTAYTKLVTLPAGSTQYVDNSLFAHTNYFYKVQSKNVSGSSAFSNELEVNSLNNSPVINPISNVTLRYDDELILEVSATDVDNDFLVFAANPATLPSFVQVFDYGEGTAYLSIKPTTAANLGIYNGVQLNVQDSYGGTHSVQFNITVNSNHTPVVSPVSPQTVKETNTLQFTVTGSDADLDAITWSIPNAPSFITSVSNGNSLNVTAAPGQDHAGIYNVTFTATDINGASASQIMVLTVEDYDPNFNVKVNFRTDAGFNAPSDWNNVGNGTNNSPLPTTLLNKENGTTSGITLTSVGNWERYKDSQGVYPGVYPDNVNRTLFQYYGTTGSTITLSGLNPQGEYNLKFLSSAASNYETWANLITVFTVSGQTQSINARGNANNLASFTALTPNAQGQLSILIQAQAGTGGLAILNAMVIESYYQGTTPPLAPTNLEASVTQSSAIQLTWVDNASNEQSLEVERSTDGNTFNKIATLARETTSYLDNTFVAGVTYYYQVRAVNGIGASAYSNINSITGPNRKPVILPVNAISIPEMAMQWVEVTGTDGDNDALTFELENEPGFIWAEYVDDTRANLVISPSLGDKGTYQFLLHCDDPNGGRTTATINVIVNSASDIEYKINFTSTGLAATPWNNVTSTTANYTLANLKNSNDVSTAVGVTLVNAWGGYNPNGYNTGNNSGIYPDAVMSSSMFIQDGSTKTIQINGLNAAKSYDFTFFASRMGVADVRNTVYSSGTKSAILNASGNTSNTTKLIGLKPTAGGQISISIAQQSGSAFAYLGSMVIREYETIIVPTVPETPVGLISQVLTRTSIKLNWQDVSSDETGFEIWRSTGNSTNYALLTTLAAGVTTFTNTGLATSTLYYYKVRAINAVGPSPFSNETNGSTYDYSVSINFNAFDGNAPGWNNVTAFYTTGNTLTNLLDDASSNTGISMTVVQEFAGTNPWGTNTTNNSGIVPDKVMVGSWWIDTGTQATLRFNNLSFLKQYNFSFFANRDAGGDRTTVYTINGLSVNLNASFNTTSMVQIKNISPELDGTITVTITTTQASQFGYLNGLIIQAVPNTGGGGGRTASKNSDETSLVSEKPSAAVGIEAYPNPFTDRITMQIGAEVQETFQVTLLNAAGIEVFNGKFDRRPDVDELELILNEDLSSGLYMLRVIDSSGKSHILRLIKK